MSNPYGMPGVPPTKSRSPLYIAVACGCAFLLALVLVAGGIGAFVLLREPTDRPTDDPMTTATEPSDQTDEPTEEPTEEPTAEATEESVVSISVAGTQEGATVDTEDEQLTPENGKFVGIALTIENTGSETIGLSGDNFVVYDENGSTYPMRYASFSTSGPQIEPGESATAALYVDVSEDTVIESVSYTDSVGTGGQEVVIPVS